MYIYLCCLCTVLCPQGSLVARAILHPTDPMYNATSWCFYAALLQLGSPLALTEHAQIMCMR